MADLNPEFIERYQLEYAKNPKSKVFAPLSEAYRRLGLIEEAFQVAAAGVKFHPDFASGRVALARILIDKKIFEEALAQLKKAAELSPDNLLAHSLIGDLYIQLRRPKDALRAFKMVLFLHPKDEKAQKAVQKWEFLTADEYEDELFEMKPLFQSAPLRETASGSALATTDSEMPSFLKREVERALSLADAFTVRDDLEQAIAVLTEAQRRLGSYAELNDRLKLLNKRYEARQKQSVVAPDEPAKNAFAKPGLSGHEQKRARLETILQRINSRRL